MPEIKYKIEPGNSTFITKDSAGHKTYSSGMTRENDESKTMYDLLIPLDSKHPMLIRWAELLTRGAKKYSRRNFEKACTQEELERATQSLWRHFIQYVTNVNDGEDHAAAIFFNIEEIELIKEKLNGN